MNEDEIKEEAKKVINKTEEFIKKPATINFLKTYWKEIVLFILAFGFIFMMNHAYTLNKELKVAQEAGSRVLKMDQIEQGLSNVLERQKMYPKLDELVKQNNANRKEIQKLREELKKQYARDNVMITGRIDKMKLNELSKEFEKLGYPNQQITIK